MRVSTSDSLALFTSPLCVFTKFDAPHLLKVSRLGILGQTGGRSRFETFFGGAGSVLAGGRLGHLLGGVRSERKRPALGRRRNHICSRHKPQEACWTVWLLGRGSFSYSLVDRHPQRGSALKPITLTTHARAPRAYSTGVAGFSGLIAFSIFVWRDRS